MKVASKKETLKLHKSPWGRTEGESGHAWIANVRTRLCFRREILTGQGLIYSKR